MKKLFSLLTVLTISGISFPNVLAVNPYQSQKTKNLSDLIKVVDLGNIISSAEDDILHAIVALNPGLRVNELRVAQVYNNRWARIIFADAPDNTTNNNFVVVSFNISSEGRIGNSIFYNSHTRLEPHRPAPTIPTIEITSNEIPGGEITSNEIPNSTIRSNNEKENSKNQSKKPIYATVLPKSERRKQNKLLSPVQKPRNLSNFLVQTVLGELPDNLPTTISNHLRELNPTLDLNQISITDITLSSAMITSNQNSRYTGSLQVTFTLNAKDKQNSNKTDENEPDNDSNANANRKVKDMINKFNNLSKQSKQNKLDEINDYYQTLSENDKANFKNKLKNIGLGLTSSGISGAGMLGISKMVGVSPMNAFGSAIKNIQSFLSNGFSNIFSRQISTITETADSMELTSLLSSSTGELTAVETLTAEIETEGGATALVEGTILGTEAAATALGEGTILGTEAAVSASLAPETLGLSIVIGGLIMAGTSFLVWWLSPNNTAPTKHESHNQYDEIEKYYKFLAHDQLKLDISYYKWNKIKQIYKANSNNYKEFQRQVKIKIANFNKEDHSGWRGAITDEDINVLIKTVFNNFWSINSHFEDNYSHGWTIITNTIGSYFAIEKE